MAIPDWRTHPGGSRVRAALWLAAEVGEGNTFTKASLRDAFPAIEQIDRRMRDLRGDGWVIATYREDRGLEPDQLRLVKLGSAVWDENYRRPSDRISGRERIATFSADGYMCRICGIAAGDRYPDSPLDTARLVAARVGPGGKASLVTRCHRCNATSSDDGADVRPILDAAEALEPNERLELIGWMHQGFRTSEPVDRIWSAFLRLPAAARGAVEGVLAEQASPLSDEVDPARD